MALQSPSDYITAFTQTANSSDTVSNTTILPLPSMTSRKTGRTRLSFTIRFVYWACLGLFLQIAPFVHSTFIPHSLSDPSPRAALVTLAHERDLPALLSSIHQLEDTFNKRYSYDWVFFSTKSLSTEFRQLTSNATKATCIYEVIRSQADGKLRPNSQHRNEQPTHTDRETQAEATGWLKEPTQILRQIYRWNCGPFAKERRLEAYDWFWRIEPGAQFPYDINFDVFRFMEEHDIGYGSNKASLAAFHRSSLSQQVEGFLSKHPELLHADADVSWILGSFNTENDLEQDEEPDPDTDIADDEDDLERDSNFSMEMFMSWLSGIFKGGSEPAFEIGSLSFFRSQSHQVLLDHLDEFCNLYDGDINDMWVPTISASIFLPQKSVWTLRHKERYSSRPEPPDSTPEPKLRLWHRLNKVKAQTVLTKSTDIAGQDTRCTVDSLERLYAHWETVSRDIVRQDCIPGLQSGNTVIDERNFAPSQ